MKKQVAVFLTRFILEKKKKCSIHVAARFNLSLLSLSWLTGYTCFSFFDINKVGQDLVVF